MDKFHGHGGTYEVDKATGERRLKEEPTKPEPAGGGARDKDGKLFERPAPDAKSEPALPEPGPAPWSVPGAATPADPVPADPAPAKKKGA